MTPEELEHRKRQPELAKPLSVMEPPPDVGTPAPLVRPAMQIEAPAPQSAIPQNSTMPARARSFVGPVESPNERELQRLTVGPESRIGAEQIKNKPLRILGRIGAGLLDTLLPAASISVPGTELHHELLTHQATQRVQNEDELVNNEAKRRLEAAQTAEHEAMPEYRANMAQSAADRVAAQAEANRIKEELGTTKNELTKAHQTSAESAQRRKMGLKLDPITGAEIPITREEMTPAEQSHLDLTEASTKLKEAQEARAQAQASGDPERIRIQDENLKLRKVALQNALENTGLRREHLDLLRGGQDESQALPGQVVQDGQTVGTAFQRNAGVQPTGQMLTKGQYAKSALTQIGRMKQIVAAHPEVFGPVSGRKTDFKTWIGSEIPDAKEFQSALKITADHSAALFGGRSNYIVKELKEALGQFKDNPAAALAGMKPFEVAAAEFARDAKPTARGAGGNATPPRPAGVPENAVYNPQTKRWREP